MAGLILDTCVVIAAGRQRLDLTTVVAGQDVGLPAVVVAELLRGVPTDPDRAGAADQEAFLDDLVRISRWSTTTSRSPASTRCCSRTPGAAVSRAGSTT